MNQASAEIIRELANTLDRVGHGRKRAEVERVADALGWSVHKVYEALKKVGWSSGRKKRSDAGKSVVTEQVLRDLATTITMSTRANGKIIMDVPNARSLLAANGREINVSNGHINRLLKKRVMNGRQLKRATPHTQMKSLHPNHVHQVDPSYCVLYYLPGKKGQSIQRFASDDEFYKNKPQNIERNAALRVWRYVLTDHYSGSILVRYYQSAGETQTNLWDFMLWCWTQIPGRVMHGVPKILIWDKGSANTSTAIKNALSALEVSDIPHRAKNARAKGQVEGGNNLVEKLFESRLRFEPVSCVEELNEAAERWCSAYNANAIPHYDSRLHRDGMSQPLARFSLWQTIRQEQLRVLPDIALCRSLLTSAAQSRVVSQSMTISFRHPQAGKSLTYDLRDLPEVYPGIKVEVAPLVYGDCQVKVTVSDYKDEKQYFNLSPVVFDGLSGFRVDAPVWGAEFDTKPDTRQDTNRKAAERNAYPDATSDDEIDKLRRKNAAPFGGLDAHSHLGDVYKPAFMQRPGVDIELPNTNRLEAKPLSVIETAKRLRASLGRAVSAAENQLIRERYPNGVPPEEFDQLLELIKNPEPEKRFSLVK
ncbi:MAG: integrase [Pseudohongiella nitratireducens]|nr:integrase [Pseudohongiella nitratireducens]MDF1622500.1 integrase [Pseudohongiella nitratireducens]